ncbi:DUF1801 domain-containing protein [Lacimicrobium sp. SS2-24]|uniref:DUF1801 domain-containing protein n=1 Tax=Lacimicrobium sp. SS2-24 TaxID=2005569 RepID=UPI000B4AF057|nr:DUF1801 domain-containing protein [Lacimicrobium sp. SS2-24]
MSKDWESELQKVENFINDIQSVNPEHAKIIQLVRELFTQEEAEIRQGIKYGGLCFFQEGVLISGVFPYKHHLSIEFSHGSDFSDPSSELEGQGKDRRHLKIFTIEDITTKNALYFVKQALGE